jgi:hypothetical protein
MAAPTAYTIASATVKSGEAPGAAFDKLTEAVGDLITQNWEPFYAPFALVDETERRCVAQAMVQGQTPVTRYKIVYASQSSTEEVGTAVADLAQMVTDQMAQGWEAFYAPIAIVDETERLYIGQALTRIN